MATNDTNQAEWHVLDAQGQTLGRLATRAASLLLGKHRTDARSNAAAPVYVVVINASKVQVTGAKSKQKMYRWHTGTPGGLKERTFEDQMRRDARVIIERAVAGMLPKNTLREARMRHLKVYEGADHPHQAQITTTSDS